ncbi:sigma-70 family RNA polymerase sigma factor [Bacillus salitolerans]|uniref:Sigma-70 family RNA polymerase sigma factor n=1 Tax=Bacillus salitolerans TaxID=1437434 RepID=A0ABW4LVA7_9BACI
MTVTPEQSIQNLGNPLRDVRKQFDEIVIPFRPELWRYCYRITGSPWDAEDLVQETLIKAFSSLAQLWQPINPKGYLFKIASNTWIDQCRKMKGKMDSIEMTSEPVYVEEYDSFAIEGAMEHLVIHLPPRQRVVLLLIDVFQFKAKEVGAIIGTTEGAVKSLLNRGRGKLKQLNEQTLEGSHEPLTNEEKELINKYIQAFNRRDPDGIANLLDENMNHDIVHIAMEYGRDVVRKYSLADWAKDPVEMTAEMHYLWGRPAVVQFGKINDAVAVYDVTLLKIENGKIIEMKDYYFCPELLSEAAAFLQIEAFPRNYTL